MIPFVILAMEDEDERAFMTDVYLKYERLLWAEIRKKLQNHPEAEDVFQSVVAKLVANVKKLRSMDTRGMVNYIITAAQHTAIDELRRGGKVCTDSMDDEEWLGRLSLQAEGEMEDMVGRREAVGRLKAVWPQLDERSRYLLEGKYFLDLSTREMGEAMGITHDSVRVELSRARKKARKLLEEKFGMTEPEA